MASPQRHMEKQPHFEDENIRIWRTEKTDVPGVEADPTVLTLDAETEEAAARVATAMRR